MNNLVRLRLIYARTFSQLIQPMAQTCSIPVSIVLDIEWLRSLEKSLFTRLHWPVKMGKPCSQLNSKVIRDKVECHIVGTIEKTCSVVAFKCV